MTTIKYHTKEAALTAVTQKGYELKFCAQEFQNDEDVVMAAVKKIDWSFEYASDTLKNNKNFILKALHEGAYPFGLVKHANIVLQSDIEVITLMLEKSNNGCEFRYAKGLASLNKELAAKALVKWGSNGDSDDLGLWANLHPTLQEFFPENCWHEKAQAYLYHIKQEKQKAADISGGSTDEDGVVW